MTENTSNISVNVSEVETPIQTIESDSVLHKCIECKKPFSSTQHLQRHIENFLIVQRVITPTAGKTIYIAIYGIPVKE